MPRIQVSPTTPLSSPSLTSPSPHSHPQKPSGPPQPRPKPSASASISTTDAKMKSRRMSNRARNRGSARTSDPLKQRFSGDYRTRVSRVATQKHRSVALGHRQNCHNRTAKVQRIHSWEAQQFTGKEARIGLLTTEFYLEGSKP